MSSFKELFAGRESIMAEKLDVSHGLLPMLKDKGILREQHIEDIKDISEKKEHRRAEKLLELLKRCDDKLVNDFLEALKESGQTHVVEILAHKLTVELWEIIETKYGLVDELYCEEVISNRDLEAIAAVKDVCRSA